MGDGLQKNRGGFFAAGVKRYFHGEYFRLFGAAEPNLFMLMPA
jgi:hypothetical protein